MANSPQGPTRPQPAIFQLIYTSSSAKPFTEEDLRRLLQVARDNNRRLGLSGMLVYCKQTFFQVLEGPQDSVEKLFKVIERDPRHSDVRIIRRSTATERDFAEWSMGFATPSQAAGSDGFNDFLTENFSLKRFTEQPSAARTLLVAFRLGSWRESVQTG